MTSPHIFNEPRDNAFMDKEKALEELFKRHPEMRELLKKPTNTREQAEAVLQATQRVVSIEKDLHKLKADRTHLESIIQWLKSPLKLDKNDTSRLHKFVQAADDGLVLMTNGNAFQHSGEFSWSKVQAFVVQHDWASAFANAEDYEGGEFNLPFPRVAFEFRISGRNVTVLCAQDEGQTVNLVPFINVGDYWYCPADQTDNEPAIKMCYAQIKAICVALEAEVATREQILAPERLNRKRMESGRIPLFSYHVVNLHRKYRGGVAGGAGSSTSRRLHFRRGHWRHLKGERTVWVRWTLVGDPDLGFVDKEYRL